MYETPLVQLQPEGEWSADIDAMVVYSQLRPFPTSSWDWIGLYKVSETLLHTSGGLFTCKGFCLKTTLMLNGVTSSLDLECLCEFQVGFTSVSDYITYSWVKDDEVSTNKEAIQVSESGADDLVIGLDPSCV